MTVNMSSEGDSSKNLSSESNEKGDAESTDSSQDVKDAKPNATENSVEKKEEDSKTNDAPKEKSDETDAKKEDKTENDSKSPEKKEEKAKDEEDTEENSEQDEEGSDNDEEKDVPLLDQPLEKSGKRERKNMERYKETPEPKDAELPNGPGTSLGSIPRIDASISRFKNDDMKVLHKILFKIPAKTTMIKKNIKKFNGFEFKKDSDEYNKKVALMNKHDPKQLKSICEMLDLYKTGTKDDIIERIMAFLMEPKDSGKTVGGGRPKRTAAVRANNRGYSSHDNYSSDERHSGRSGRDKGLRPNLKDDTSSASDEDFEPSDEGSDERPSGNKRKRDRKRDDSDDDDDEDASEMDSLEESDDEPKNKRKKAAKVNVINKGKTPGRRGRKPGFGKKAGKGGRKKKESSEDEEDEESEHKEDGSSSSEDEPLAKKATKATQPPTDEEIKTYVKEFLDGANLEKITMKTVCQQVYAHYPDFDLTHKKDFIKSTVRSLIST